MVKKLVKVKIIEIILLAKRNIPTVHKPTTTIQFITVMQLFILFIFIFPRKLFVSVLIHNYILLSYVYIIFIVQ